VHSTAIGIGLRLKARANNLNRPAVFQENTLKGPSRASFSKIVEVEVGVTPRDQPGTASRSRRYGVLRGLNYLRSLGIELDSRVSDSHVESD
jgi:hypothetical protein